MFKEFWQKNFRGDILIWGVFFTLIGISIVEVYSATSSLAYGRVFLGNYNGPIAKHITFCAAGVLAAFAVHRLDVRKWNKLAIYVIWPLLLLVVLSTSLTGVATNGAARWSSLPIVGSFQPTEFLKLAFVLAAAYCFSQHYRDDDTKKLRRKVLFVTCVTCAAIFLENFSNALIVLFTGALVWVLFKNSRKALVITIATVLLGTFASVKFAQTDFFKDSVYQTTKSSISGIARMGTVLGRFVRYANEKEPGEEGFEIDAKNFQSVHGKIAMANSHGIGLRPGRSIERDYLPQAYSDFIYAIIVEEMGLFGAVLVVFLYLLLLYRIGHIVAQCQSMFCTITAAGLGFMLVIQALINTSVATGIIPVTGQPLPLISRGGSSIIVVSVYIGILQSICRFDCARNNQQKEENEAPTPA